MIRKRTYNVNYEALENINIYFAKLQEQLDYAGFAKLFGIKHELNQRIQMVYKDMEFSAIKKQKFSYVFSGIDSFISLFCNILIYIYGGLRIIEGTFTIGKFTVYNSYFSMLLESVKFFFEFGNNYQNILVSYNRIVDILKMDTELYGDNIPDIIDNLRVNKLNFSFKNKKLFENFNSVFSKGLIYGIIGDNGSGKTTLMNIIIGAYNLDKDVIMYNDFNITEMNLQKIRRERIGLVEQDAMFLNDSLAYNFYWKKELTESEKNVVSNLLSYFDIDYLEVYLNKNLDFSTLSGGEKQKLAIIRAIIKQPDIQIWDEPTSALDKKNRQNVIQIISEMRGKCLFILISHDRELLEICDTIISVDSI